MSNIFTDLLKQKAIKQFPFNQMLVSALKEMQQEGLQLSEEKEITIDINDLSKENIDLIFSVSDKFNILINKDTFILTQENCSKLISFNEYIKQTYSKDLAFPLSSSWGNNKPSEVWSIEKTLNANSKIEDWTAEINNARIDGKELSPFEKYLFAYHTVSHFTYNEEEREDGYELSRTVVGALNSDKIVCVGFADLLSNLCQRVGIECFQQYVACDGKNIDHCNCCVRIDDDKYNIHGIYYADPCWDSYREETENTLQHSLLVCDEVDKGFTEDPIAFKTDGLAKFAKSKKQTYSYQQLKEIAETYTTKEQRAKLLKFIASIRQDFGVEVEDDKEEMNLISLASILNPDEFYKIDLSSLGERRMDFRQEYRVRKIFEKFPDEKIAEAINIVQICSCCGNSNSALDTNENGVYEKLNLEILDLVKKPTQLSKQMYCSALCNVYLSKGKTKEEAISMTQKVWKNSIAEVKRTQSIGRCSFSTPFVKEAKDLAQEVNELV